MFRNRMSTQRLTCYSGPCNMLYDWFCTSGHGSVDGNQ